MKRLIKRSKSRRKHKRKAKQLDSAKLKKWSLSVRGRDNFTCVSCGKTTKTHAHHMVSKYYRPQYAYSIDNGITLCKQCHLGRGGVHNKRSNPKNELIKKLRLIFKLNDIRSSLSLGQRLARKSKPVNKPRVKPRPKKKLNHRYLSKRPRSLTK